MRYYQEIADCLRELRNGFKKGSDMETITAVSSPHKLGKHFKHGLLGHDFVLAQTDGGHVALISTETGNRFNNPIQVQSIYAITNEEWDKISSAYTGVGFTPAEGFELEQPSENVCICQKIMIPEIIPEVSVGFRYKGTTVLCYVQVKQKLRIGVSNCSEKDSFNPRKGEKIALRRALAQFDLCYIVRAALWEQYLYTKGIKAEPDRIIAFFKNQVTFNM